MNNGQGPATCGKMPWHLDQIRVCVCVHVLLDCSQTTYWANGRNVFKKYHSDACAYVRGQGIFTFTVYRHSLRRLEEQLSVAWGLNMFSISSEPNQLRTELSHNRHNHRNAKSPLLPPIPQITHAGVRETQDWWKYEEDEFQYKSLEPSAFYPDTKTSPVWIVSAYIFKF